MENKVNITLKDNLVEFYFPNRVTESNPRHVAIQCGRGLKGESADPQGCRKGEQLQKNDEGTEKNPLAQEYDESYFKLFIAAEKQISARSSQE